MEDRVVVLACWSPKGGAGTTVVSAALAILLARSSSAALLVDLGGDAPLVLGAPSADGPGIAQWLAAAPDVPADALARIEVPLAGGLSLLPRGAGPLPHGRGTELLARLLAVDRRPVVVDCGRVDGDVDVTAPSVAVLAAADRSLAVLRPCFIAARRAATAPVRPDGIVVVREPGRSLQPADLEHVLGAPVVATVRVTDTVARAVDAGLLLGRLPRTLAEDIRRAA